MDELDPESRDALRRYRDDTTLPGPARARVWQRLDAALDVEDIKPPPRRASRRTATIVLLTALAAALLLTVWDLRARRDGAHRPTDSAAPYTAPPAQPGPTHARPPPPPATRPATPEPKPATPRPTQGLAAELAQLQQARAALDAHDPGAALQRLDEHAARFPDGQLREDRQFLRLEALCARGETLTARTAAATFLQEFPTSPHAPRLADFCPATPNPVTDRSPGGESTP